MSVEFSVPLSDIVNDLKLNEVYVAENYEDINITTVEINRPGLELTGYFEFFDNKRIQVLGNTEFSYLGRFGSEAQRMVIDSIFSFGPPAVIICRDIEPSTAILESAKLHKVSIFSTDDSTSDLTARLVQYLNHALAPRITRHGVLVEVYGEGCLLIGDSGVGKSETAMELIKRGHRLVADDAVEIRRTSATTLIGQSPANIRHFIELRGIGIINARKLFGMGAVKMQEKIDMVINLELWDSAKVYDRMGLDNEYMDILGVEVPTLTIPVKPGRNLAVIIEVAAMNNRQKKMGYNAAQDLLRSLGMDVDEVADSPKTIVDKWE
ncbi:HPr(Ser) kinase/phosphatase [Ruminococcus sp.]|uniref:HPr(Ser) kinase/phosphatase n=1 Tax=Ruminococcus sp. TaxID=41978 RepID=UPI0025DB5D24|nr:HPr(Ser) kinase/phosphatase [Ruminococcus sp.]MCI6615836.1 HPr(Ser) kinase/phosphatase [Ruminococcus sp.]